MKYAYFPGCKIPHYLEAYGRSTKAVLEALGVDLAEPEFNCCGYPNRHISTAAYLLSAARNLAIAERHGLEILTPCKCCFGSLKLADHRLREEPELRNEINRLLAKEHLRWEGKTGVRHLLSILKHDVGLDRIKAAVTRPLKDLKVAAHYGCHALRPGKILHFDNPLAPTLFEELVNATGAKSVDWSRRLECCGAPLWEKNDPLATALSKRKLTSAHEAGAHYVCTACTYCQIQFDTVRQAASPSTAITPAILYPQLLGLSLGLPETSLGLEMTDSSPMSMGLDSH